ncbi:zinc transporter 10-like [Polypterus senegalus]|uniref:zinc transporter 10-like n=1 Tax=Polypterus senegalus TaxID=55291 RepID=UPI001963DC95|nr:zinc transporter 10-like [Polypterus senegalus]
MDCKRGNVASSTQDKVIKSGLLGIQISLGAEVVSDINNEKVEKKGKAFHTKRFLLHMFGDTLISAAVIVSSGIFYFSPLDPKAQCNWKCYVDPAVILITVVIRVMLLYPALKVYVTNLMQMAPEGVQVDKICADLMKITGVQGIHELHVWALETDCNIATLHVKCADSVAYEKLCCQTREIFHKAGVHSITIQPEMTHQEEPTEAVLSCTAPCQFKTCQSMMCCALFSERGKGHSEDSSYPADVSLPKSNILGNDGINVTQL